MNLFCSRSLRPLATALVAVFLGAAAFAQTTFSGQATAIIVTDSTNPPGGIVLCDTGPLSSSGGTLSASLGAYDQFGIMFDAATADAIGMGAETDCTSTLTNLSFELMPPSGGMSFVTASFVGTHANATAKSNGSAALSGDVNVQGLVVNGVAVAVTGKPNQLVTFPGGQITINEQSTNGNEITVVGLHIVEFGCANVLVNVSRAGVTAASSPPPAECGKLTGGGWIVGTPGGGKGTFGVGGGMRFGEPWGHLEYTDHDTGMNVHATATTSFTLDPNDSRCATITYNVDINGAPGGTATVHACDFGEPGRDDTFDITLSSGYHASGDLGGSSPGGGNIQMHKCPPGWLK